MEFIEIASAKMINVDCLVYMRQLPDKYFDLAIVDPPYGIGISKNPVRGKHGKKQWDNAIPSGEYFKELRRISGDQIIWGGNYFIEHLTPSRGFIVWYGIKYNQKISALRCASKPGVVYRHRPRYSRCQLWQKKARYTRHKSP